ncbi:hypothetical protein FOFC_04337 [Fusarium oxysporum]|nr:hypothetical protein FOFC_04337 [Fusarium oxysporum]
MVIGSLTQLPKGQGRSGTLQEVTEMLGIPTMTLTMKTCCRTKGTGLITAWPVVSSAH